MHFRGDTDSRRVIPRPRNITGSERNSKWRHPEKLEKDEIDAYRSADETPQNPQRHAIECMSASWAYVCQF